MKKILISILCTSLAISTLACIKRHQTATTKSVTTTVETTVNTNDASNKVITNATNATYNGYFFVEDSTSALIPDATITLINSGKTIITSWDGRFFISRDLLTNSVPVSVTAPGYDTISTTLTLNSTRILQLKRLRYQDENIYYTMEAGSKSRVRGVGSVKMATKATYDYAGAVPAPSDDIYMETEAAMEDEDVITTMAMPETKIKEHPAMASMANNISAGKLTAGEVNDFAKWHLWSNVIGQSHKQFVDIWKIYTDKRYVAQVTNKKGFPMVDMQVRLTDAQGNTLFSAKTDNTGRAELWLCDGKIGNNGQLMIQVGNEKKEAICFNNGITNFVVNEDCFVPTDADVFFIFDATGSMVDELRYLQAEMKDVVQRSQSAIEGLNIRTGALVYRDHGDEYLTRISRLSNDIQATQDFIDAQMANGGGDYEEGIPEALMAAINAADWSSGARARIAFLILDAPCHQDSATVRLMREQLLNAASMGIRIVPVVCSGLQESGELLMRSTALITNGTSFFLTDDSGIGHTHLKPTTDSLKVEHLNDMMVRTIISFTRMPECNVEDWADDSKEDEDIEQFLPAPFTTDDLDSVPTTLPLEPKANILNVKPNPCTEYCLVDLPKGTDATYLCDVSGKTIRSLGKQEVNTTNLMVDMSYLSTGVYFIKAFYGGRWYAVKVIKA